MGEAFGPMVEVVESVEGYVLADEVGRGFETFRGAFLFHEAADFAVGFLARTFVKAADFALGESGSS